MLSQICLNSSSLKTNMGVDLVPEVLKDSFAITEGKFVAVNDQTGDPQEIAEYSVENGCITPGWHRVFRFTILTRNKGTEDLEIGAPENRQDIFAHPGDLTPPLPDAPNRWYLKEKFFNFSLKDSSGTTYSGFKRPFCVMGGINHKTNPPTRFNCNYQGIGYGNIDNFDSYPSFLPCQFIIIDGLKDGICNFEATINAPKIFKEDNYNNNSVSLKIQFNGNNPPVVV
jgi:hypothetical protein